MTNDGELANALTRAASHVPKTYLVKVSGIPDENALNALRRGVSIPLGDPESNTGYRGREGRVRTAPAKVRLFRAGENPWYEITITEGRNRQLRKMFEEVGHHVEKIRRVEYGPLVLDLPPGESRELTAQEVQALYRAAKLTSCNQRRQTGGIKIEAANGPPTADFKTFDLKLQTQQAHPVNPGDSHPFNRSPGLDILGVRPEFRGNHGGNYGESDIRSGMFLGRAGGVRSHSWSGGNSCRI